jgi:hypothetical protein
VKVFWRLLCGQSRAISHLIGKLLYNEISIYRLAASLFDVLSLGEGDLPSQSQRPWILHEKEIWMGGSRSRLNCPPSPGPDRDVDIETVDQCTLPFMPGPYPFVSAGAVDLLQELSYSSCLRVTQEDSRVLDGRPLTDVFGIVISTVLGLREPVKWREDGCPRPTITLWSTLIKALAHACSEALLIM